MAPPRFDELSCLLGDEGNLRFFNGALKRPERIQPWKVRCGRCGTPIADDGRTMWMAFSTLFDFGEPPRVPEAFRPICHIFYGSRVIDAPGRIRIYWCRTPADSVITGCSPGAVSAFSTSNGSTISSTRSPVLTRSDRVPCAGTSTRSAASKNV